MNDRRSAGNQAVGAVRRILEPNSIAVIGASRKPESIGGRLLHNILEAGFGGAVIPINPAASEIEGVPAYGSILDVAQPVDMAIVAVPAEDAVQAARDCARKGVGALVVVSAGFAEVGSQGVRIQQELIAVCRAGGMRLVGPNCMGVANLAPHVSLNGQFAPIRPSAGNIAVLSQSGALGVALMYEARRRGLGLSSFVSVGNQADLSANDFLAYWAEDSSTDVILLYLESIVEPRRFADVCARLARRKPIIVVKSGRSAAGARATASHTGGLVAASDATVDALFDKAGVIRCGTVAEMFDVAALLASQPIPAGGRVAIVTNGGGPGILAADACVAAGLEVPPFDTDTARKLAEHLPATAGVANPVDMVASATPADYAQAISLIGADRGFDALLVISGPPLTSATENLARAVHDAVASMSRPLSAAAVFMSTESPGSALQGDGLTVPAFETAEGAAHALGRAVRYGRWRRAPRGRVPRFDDLRRRDAAALIDAAAGESHWLAPREVRALLDCYRLPMVREESVSSSDELDAARVRLGGLVALKAISRSIVHKSEAGGVRLGLASATAIRRAAREMASEYRAAGHEVDGFVVQEMIPPGVEMLVGAVRDVLFGAVVACAAGGTLAELMRDVALRITPLTNADAATMIGSLAAHRLLEGYRGSPRADISALEDVLLRVSSMVGTHPQIAELDLNPVIVSPRGAVIVDARIRIDAGSA